jgi:hypothetical protein
MHSKVFSDRLPSYIKVTRPVLEIFRMAGYFRDSPCIYTHTYTYEDKSNENLKYFYLMIHWTQKYTMTSFSYVVSIACYFIRCYAAIFLHDGFNCCNGP